VRGFGEGEGISGREGQRGFVYCGNGMERVFSIIYIFLGVHSVRVGGGGLLERSFYRS
jgi:hypothetical protein